MISQEGAVLGCYFVALINPQTNLFLILYNEFVLAMLQDSKIIGCRVASFGSTWGQKFIVSQEGAALGCCFVALINSQSTLSLRLYNEWAVLVCCFVALINPQSNLSIWLYNEFVLEMLQGSNISNLSLRLYNEFVLAMLQGSKIIGCRVASCGVIWG